MIAEIIIFSLGLLIGSFLNVVIYRLPKNQSIVWPGSHCPKCQEDLKAIDLIPVFSFVFSKGKCRYCQTKISYQYPLVELITAIFSLGVYLKYGFSTHFFIYNILIFLLIISSFVDLKYQIIPNKITYPGVVIALLTSCFFDHISILNSVLGIILAGGFLLVIAILTKGGMGIGDVKLAALNGSVLGAKFALLGIFLGSLIGSIISLFLIYAGIKSRRDRIPFGPFIAIGTVVMIFWGNEIINWYFGLF
ncbi:prepilin peptidase [Orenia marismortui]|uniref:prepilin peptidase n=1 Tax=Orenia marismortui TaxID=46469 RepID=UPI00036A8412|nr:A24 family peptidase [Orenia marismortui]